MSNQAQQSVGNYAGPDRRRHKVFVTRNSEYHCRDGVCVAVLNKQTGDFVRDHAALGLQISTGVRFDGEGEVPTVFPPGTPEVGDQLCFSRLGLVPSRATVITSTVRAVGRPAKEVVLKYSPTLH
jgi:hypothetical protein